MLNRPKYLKDVVGQKEVLANLKTNINAAKSERRVLGHTLFYGSGGLGKTTLANAIANEMGGKFIEANGASVRSVPAMMEYLKQVEEGAILFIDEIHASTIRVYEFLYTVMEDFSILVGDPEKNCIKIPMAKFTLVGATTDAGKLPDPLRQRFINKYSLQPYSIEDLSSLIIKNSQSLNMNMTQSAAETLAKVSRGTPRIANNYLLWIRDVVVDERIGTCEANHVMTALERKGIDKQGMTIDDRKYLDVLKRYDGRPVALKTIVSEMNASKDDVVDIIEPYLVRLDKILKTPRGRILK